VIQEKRKFFMKEHRWVTELREGVDVRRSPLASVTELGDINPCGVPFSGG